MDRPKVRKVIAGMGWAMLALFLTTVGLRIAHWATKHAGTLDGVIITSGVVMCSALGFWLYTKDDAVEIKAAMPAPTNKQKVVVGNGNSGDVMTAGRDIYNLHTPPVPQEPVAPKPNLVISKPEACFLYFDYLYWKKLPEGEKARAKVSPGAIFWIHNEPFPQGHTGTASGVSVGLTFRERGAPPTHIERTCLIEHRENAVNLESNQRCGVFIATFYGSSVLKVCDNKTELDQTIWLRSRPLPGSPSIRREDVNVNEMVEIEAVVLSGTEILAKHTFNCIRTPENVLYIV